MKSVELWNELFFWKEYFLMKMFIFVVLSVINDQH